MPLIKHTQADALTRSALVLDLGDLRKQADAIVSAAREDAARVMAEAETEAARLIANADERGHAEGHARGLTEGSEAGRAAGRAEAVEGCAERFTTLAEAWTAALDRWETERASMLLSAREDVLEFALTMARKIVLRVATVDPRIIQDQLAETLAMLCRPSALGIVINPEDRAIVEEVLPALLERVAQCEHASVREDPAVGRGGCIVEAGEGSIDATLEKQLDRIAATLIPAAAGCAPGRSAGDAPAEPTP